MFELNNCLQLVLDIHELGDLKSYKTTDHGYSGKSYIIESSKGIYFIKFYKKSRPIYQIEFEHEVTKIISSKALEDCPVLPPLTNKNFQSWFLLENCYVSVFPYIQGFSIESGNFSYRQVYFAAKSLAILHKNLQRINLTRESYYQWKLASSKSSIQDLAKISKLIELKKKKDEFDKFAMKAIASFTESLLETSKKFEALQRLPGQLTHGDFHNHNLLFDSQALDRILGIVDWEMVGMRPRIYDISIFLGLAILGLENPLLSFDKMIYYIEIYHHYNKLSLIEVSSLIEIFILKIVSDPWLYKNRYLNKDLTKDALLKKEYDAFNCLSFYSTELTSKFVKIVSKEQRFYL